MDVQFQVPGLVSRFVVYFYNHIRERNVSEINTMYTSSWAKLSDRYFKLSPWPPVEYIAQLVNHDYVFCLLYKEMYYRHLYARCVPTIEQRLDSFKTYCDLFDVVLTSNVNMKLPNQWLWDMVDEFCYQFQAYCQYKGRLHQRPPLEQQMVADNKDSWSQDKVMGYLKALVDRSGIIAELEHDQGQRMYELEGALDASRSNVLSTLGYYALTGLLRIHCIHGRFEDALRALGPLHVFQSKPLFCSRIWGCHITTMYYAGFSYLMLRRYLDAAKCFNNVLVYILRIKPLLAQMDQIRSAQLDEILKRNEQIYGLLAMTVALCPQARFRFVCAPFRFVSCISFLSCMCGCMATNLPDDD